MYGDTVPGGIGPPSGSPEQCNGRLENYPWIGDARGYFFIITCCPRCECFLEVRESSDLLRCAPRRHGVVVHRVIKSRTQSCPAPVLHVYEVAGSTLGLDVTPAAPSRPCPRCTVAGDSLHFDGRIFNASYNPFRKNFHQIQF